MGIEFGSVGVVHPVAKIHTMRLLNYVTPNDEIRAVLEVLVVCMMLRFAFQEVKQMLYKWPDEQYAPTVKLRIPVMLFPLCNYIFPTRGSQCCNCCGTPCRCGAVDAIDSRHTSCRLVLQREGPNGSKPPPHHTTPDEPRRPHAYGCAGARTALGTSGPHRRRWAPCVFV